MLRWIDQLSGDPNGHGCLWPLNALDGPGFAVREAAYCAAATVPVEPLQRLGQSSARMLCPIKISRPSRAPSRLTRPFRMQPVDYEGMGMLTSGLVRSFVPMRIVVREIVMAVLDDFRI